MLTGWCSTAEQLSVGASLEKAAVDRLGVPPQQRAAFARKAKWFRMKARISAKKEAAAAIPARRLAEAWSKRQTRSRLA